jgi:hypothetical protein
MDPGGCRAQRTSVQPISGFMKRETLSKIQKLSVYHSDTGTNPGELFPPLVEPRIASILVQFLVVSSSRPRPALGGSLSGAIRMLPGHRSPSFRIPEEGR